MMKSATVVVAIVCAAALFPSLGQANSCAKLAECMTAAQEKYEQCQTMLSEQNELRNRWSQQLALGENDERGDEETISEVKQCHRELRTIMNDKKEAHQIKSITFGECIAERLEDAVPLNTKHAKKCKNLETKLTEKLSRRGRNRGGNRRRASRGSLIKQCQMEAKSISNKCRPLTKCCSEATICHLEYEQSAVHDRIKKGQMQMIFKRRECRELDRSGEVENDQADQPSLMDDFSIVTPEQIVEADL